MKLAPPALVLVAMFSLAARAADDAGRLSSVIVAGEDWQLVAEGLNFCDGPSCDAEGNLYFSEMRATPAGIWKISIDGKKSRVVETVMSGTKLGPDGRLYTCGSGQVAAFDLGSGKKTLLAENVEPNDLVISHRGHIYFTETKKGQVTFLDSKGGAPKAVDAGTKKPNGITLTPDQKTLLVSEAGGLNVWAFTIQPDGTLADRKPLMTMKAPDSKPTAAGGDGMTTDEAGRCYVATALGCQIFEKDGTLLGILPRPQEGAMPSVGFAGPNRQYLYAMCSTKIFRRKMQARGAIFFSAPEEKK